jgi:Tfp pilus assembly protein PilF
VRLRSTQDYAAAPQTPRRMNPYFVRWAIATRNRDYEAKANLMVALVYDGQGDSENANNFYMEAIKVAASHPNLATLSETMSYYGYFLSNE